MPWPNWLKLPEPVIRKILDAVLSLFETHPIRIALALILLASAFVAGNFYVARTKQYQDIVSTTVRAGEKAGRMCRKRTPWGTRA